MWFLAHWFSLVLSSQFPTNISSAYPIAFVITFLLAFEFARRRLIFWKASDGSIYSKGGVPIYLFYIAGLVARIAIGYIYIGPNFLFYIPTTTLTLSSAAISATIATDLILVAGVGLLFGRNMRILRKYLCDQERKGNARALFRKRAKVPLQCQPESFIAETTFPTASTKAARR